MRCKACRQADAIVDDHINGCALCRHCGVVADRFLVSDEAEWRNFADDHDAPDKSRVGHALAVGLPQEMQLATVIQGARTRLEDLHEWNKYHEPRDELRRICHHLQASHSTLSLCYELFGLYRSCVHVIRNADAVLASVVYHASFLSRTPIPLPHVLRVILVDRKDVAQAGRHLAELVDGQADNRASLELVFSCHPVPHGEFYRFPHLQGHTLGHRSEVMVQHLCRRWDLTGAGPHMAKVLKVYLERFPETQRTPETIAAGVFYHVTRYLSDRPDFAAQIRPIRLSDVGACAAVSDSAINDMVHQLPKFPPAKRKR